MMINPEGLGYWFFRLNGFLSIVNFVVHAYRRGESGTDADILGVRFPNRAELIERPMIDYPEFTRNISTPYIVIAEVKRGLCDLNGPWTSPHRENINRVLRAIGAVPIADVDRVAENLYDHGCFQSSNYYFSLICLGETRNNSIHTKFPSVPKILWSDVKSFIYKRFRDYRNQKMWHQQWDHNGRNLFNWFRQCKDEEDFTSGIEIRWLRNQIFLWSQKSVISEVWSDFLPFI